MRQLAAILFADMVGYTAIMQENEQLARDKRQRLKQVLENSVSSFHGKILQYYGDGTLSIFNSAIDGVSCAIQIQQQLQQEPRVDVRMGIHTGDVVIEEDAVYGDGVNIASRVESLAVPGGIFLSEKVFDEIKNQENIQVREVGQFELKNVKQPVRIFAVANAGVVVPERHELAGKTKPPVNRLAVLPFVNMSADPENEYFSDGITEELLNALTKLDGVQVTSRTSAFAFKGKNDDVRDIALKLNVDKVLEGSVRKSGNRVRITAQLVNAADGYHIWSENYDRNLTDIFEVQDEISSIIADRLRENLHPFPKGDAPAKAPTRNMEAYTLYLKGLYFWNKLTPADIHKAIECFEQAISLEPAYAQAYAMAANAYSFLGATGQMKPETVIEIVKRYSEQALRLDDTIAEGHIARASVSLLFEWKWKEAFESLQTAIRLNPAAMEAYQCLAIYYVITGQKAEAVRIMEHAVQVDPLSPLMNQYLGEMYLASERYDEALAQAEKLLEMYPQMRIALGLKAWCLGMMGDWPRAVALLEEVHRLTNHPLKAVTALGYAYSMVGDREKALDCIRRIEQRQVEEPNTVMDGDLMLLWWGLGDKEKVYYYVRQCIRKKMLSFIFYLHNPMLKGILDEPWYEELKREAGL